MLKPAFQAACRAAVEALARETGDGGPAVLIGTPWVEDGKLYNAYALLAGGRIEAIRFKVNLPNYGVFDEKRVFASGPLPGPVSFRGVRLGIADLRGHLDRLGRLRERGRMPGRDRRRASCGAQWLALLARQSRRPAQRRVARVAEAGLPLIYINQVGGQDELVFDGASFALNADRSIAFQLPAFRETVVTTHWSRTDGAWRCAQGRSRRPKSPTRRITPPACWGCAITSRRTASRASCSACPAASIRRCARRWRSMRSGRERVRCVMLPFRYTSQQSLDDAAAIASALGVRYDIVPIESAVHGLEAALAGVFAGAPRDVTEENLQSRARGTILMAISNKFGAMVVTTGNKSEMSVGYATLYGDMNGGFNPIKDLYKTEVYRLARLRNSWKPDGARGPDRRGHSGKCTGAGAERGAAREPDRPGHAAALRRARPDPRAAGRARGADRDDRRRRVSTATP